MIIYNFGDLPEELIASAAKNRTETSVMIRSCVEAAIASDVIMSSLDRIHNILDACKCPVSDDLAYNRVYANAQKDLEGEAAREGFKNQAIPVMPTIEQIHALAKKRYDENAAKALTKEQAKAEKEAKKQKLMT